MCDLLQAVSVASRHDFFPGLGYKAAAKQTHLAPSSMRYAKLAAQQGMVAAVAFGAIRDQRVVGILALLPRVAIGTICRIEVKLERRLSRDRATRLVAAYRKVVGHAT